jgi:toxin ParE1/3/4
VTTVRLSRRALKDIQEIKTYTVEHWGEAGWLRYFAGLSAALDRVAEDPAIGRPRDTLLYGMRSLTYERHLIFFMPARERGSRTAVLRIAHLARNLSALAYNDEIEG